MIFLKRLTILQKKNKNKRVTYIFLIGIFMKINESYNTNETAYKTNETAYNTNDETA